MRGKLVNFQTLRRAEVAPAGVSRRCDANATFLRRRFRWMRSARRSLPTHSIPNVRASGSGEGSTRPQASGDEGVATKRVFCLLTEVVCLLVLVAFVCRSHSPLSSHPSPLPAMFSGEDAFRPSFFEMVAAERLVSGLKPALKHLCTILATRHPRLDGLRRYSDEIFYSLLFALERHYLSEHDASFAEHFYGLRRIAVNTNLPPAVAREMQQPEAYSTALFGMEAVQAAAQQAKQAAAAAAAAGSAASTAAAAGSIAASASPVLPASSSASSAAASHSFSRPLSLEDRQRALFFLVVMPMLKSRLDALFVRWRDGVDEEGFEEAPYVPAQRSWLYNTVRRAFLAGYPWFHLCFEAGQLVQSLRFLFESSVYASPWLAVCGQVVRRMSMEDMQAEGASAAAAAASAASLVPAVSSSALDRAWPQSPVVRFLRFLRGVAGSLGRWVGAYAKYGVLLSIFAFKFLEWWYSPANAYYASHSASGARKLPIPPPPRAAPRAEGGIEVPSDKTLCPLCREERTNPAATPTGYVFCYTCIHHHLQARHACPITLRPCEVQQLRKIYEN